MPIYTDDAISDLRRIRLFIAKDSLERAIEKGIMIDETCRFLDRQPMMGRRFVGDLRLFTKRPWLILYEPLAAGVLVHRIFDSRQNWRAQLD